MKRLRNTALSVHIKANKALHFLIYTYGLGLTSVNEVRKHTFIYLILSLFSFIGGLMILQIVALWCIHQVPKLSISGNVYPLFLIHIIYKYVQTIWTDLCSWCIIPAASLFVSKIDELLLPRKRVTYITRIGCTKSTNLLIMWLSSSANESYENIYIKEFLYVLNTKYKTTPK